MTLRICILLLLVPICKCSTEDMKQIYKYMERGFNRLDKEIEVLKKERTQHIALIETLQQLLLEAQSKPKEPVKISKRKEEKKRLLIDDPGHLQYQIDELNAKVMSMQSERGGAVYVRWGKTTCPSNGTEAVFTGYAGGSYYSHTGGAAEYVCLPSDPIFGTQISVPSTATGYMFGAEYQTGYFGPAEDQNVPCVVCRSLTGTTALMIPATDQCYPGWKHEYHGHLASGEYVHASASQYVCVDQQPEVIHGGTGNDNGKLFYSVRARCGSLPCPPYKDQNELFCVVCTRWRNKYVSNKCKM